jgi:hypothetical protein
MKNQYYPTPPDLADKMIQPYIRAYKSEFRGQWYDNQYLPFNRILEPSAGRGDLINALKRNEVQRGAIIHAVEINPMFQDELRDKGIAIVDSDFLAYRPDIPYDFIIMNPPFRNGNKHLQHAFENCLAYEGKLVCILNANTLTEETESLIAQYGTSEHVQGAFTHAEHTTNVDVVIVRLEKPEGEYRNWFLEDEDFDFTENFAGQDLVAQPNAIDSIVLQYEIAKRELRLMHQQKARYDYYSAAFIPLYSDEDEEKKEKRVAERFIKDFNEAAHELRDRAWQYLFNQTQIGQRIPSIYKDKFNARIASQKNMAFSKDNILAVFNDFIMNEDQIYQETIMAAFDAITSENANVGGWKTNHPTKVKRKFIMPNVTYNPYGTISAGYNMPKLDDIDKAMARINGDDIMQVTTMKKIIMDPRNDTGTLYESTYFTLRWYKKGTAHVTFKDQHLWEQFNIIASQMRQELGEAYG